MSSFLDMPTEEGTELFLTVTGEILERARGIAAELDNLRQFLSRNEDVATALGINIIFHMMSRDFKTLEVTTDCQCIIGSQERLLTNLKECLTVITEK